MKAFPVDCEPDCEYFMCWDLSIDDYTNMCKKINVQIDDIDAYSGSVPLPKCPLEEL